MFRKVALVLASPLLLVTACAKEGDQGAVEVKTGAAAISALRAAPDAVAEAGTAAFEVVMDMTVEGQTFQLTATGVVDAAAERMSMEMDMGSMFEQLAAETGEEIPAGFDAPWEMVADGSTFYMRAPMFEMFGASGWLSMTPEDLGTSEEAMGLGAGAYDFTKTLESLRGVVGEPDVVGQEDIRGVATTHYAAMMDMEEALANVPEEQRAALEAQLDQLGDAEIPVDVWIDGDDLPRRMRMDMGAMFASLGLGDGGVTMTMDFFDYGEPVEIDIPSADEVTPFTEALGGLGGTDLGS
jgi:hypothetical protein